MESFKYCISFWYSHGKAQGGNSLKNQYFTSESLDQDADELLKRLTQYRERRPFHLRPDDSALILLDMQRYFLDPASHAFIPSAGATLPGLIRLVQAYQDLDLPVILTRHMNTPQNSGSMDKWWSDLIQQDDPMSELIPQFAELKTAVLQKEQYDAFYGTDLEDWLRERGVKQVIIGGVMTHLCCETTARSAFVRGFEVFFLLDGTATYHIDFHHSSLLTLSHGFAHPVKVREMLDGLQQTSKEITASEGISIEQIHDELERS